jgi:hypothetical protein
MRDSHPRLEPAPRSMRDSQPRLERSQSPRPAPLSVVLLVGASEPHVAPVCRRAAAAARLLLKECDLPSFETMVVRCRPLVVVLPHAVYASDPVRFDTLVRDAHAKLVRVDEEVDAMDLEPLLAAGALEARRTRDTLAPPSVPISQRGSDPLR